MADKKDRDQEQDTSFRVIDRRLFTEAGDLRPEAREREEADERAAAAAPPPEEAPKNSAGAAAGSAPQSNRSFQLLIDFLARNAAALLGAYPDPRTGQAYVDLAGARELLDMLDALREKTRGQLAPEEDKLLVEVIGSLKMTFLEVSQATQQVMREKAKGKS